jgi:osmoprotectant transport system permease protein
VAQAFVDGRTARGAPRTFLDTLAGPDFWPLTGQHLVLVFVSLAASIGIGVPLGVAAQRRPRLGRWILGAVSIVQTIPSLALLALLIAALGTIGTLPALVALSLYALLPIVRNTEAGLAGVGEGLRQAALALGLTRRDALVHIELPLAAPTILAGVKTSAVINVGTATIAAFIGAGGYGERIVQGLALNDSRLLVAGALPAAALALIVQGLFERAEKRALAWRGRGTGA